MEIIPYYIVYMIHNPIKLNAIPSYFFVMGKIENPNNNSKYLLSWMHKTIGGFSSENFFDADTFPWQSSQRYASSPSRRSWAKYVSNASQSVFARLMSKRRSWKCWKVVETPRHFRQVTRTEIHTKDWKL